MLEQGANTGIEARDANLGRAALHDAIQYHSIDIAKMLIYEFDANVDIKSTTGETPLLIATTLGSLEMVNMLLEAKADPNVVDNTKVAPLHQITFAFSKFPNQG